MRPTRTTTNENSKIALGIALALLIVFQAFSQSQVIKGKVIDAQAQYELIGATVVLLGADPIVGTVTDVEGGFRLENVPVGRQTIGIQYVGYKNVTLPNILVTAGKEVVLEIRLEESVENLEAVVVTAEADKDMPINELAKVSARTFSTEEVTRFSGGRNDVAKLASAFAGVSSANDARNDIVVRGNSPVGLLWRIEGIPIATTNHFNTLGTTGGPVNALNTNILRTSDFLTGAFPAEYGNANAAVFDINFRNGNPDKFEFTGQVSAYTGAEFMAEGPISKASNSSFVTSYRYGIASLAATGTSATPYYQDISFKVNLGDSPLGHFEVFGMGGKSSIDFYGNEIDDTDLFADPAVDAFVSSEIGMVGASNLLRFGKTAFLKTSVGVSTNANEYIQDNRILDDQDNFIKKYRSVNVDNRENRYTITSTFTRKFNSQWSMKAGVLDEIYDMTIFSEDRDNRVGIPDADNDSIPDYFLTGTDFNESYNLLQVYWQAEYKITDGLTSTFGLHGQYHGFTEKYLVEPRAAISWQASRTQRFSLAYGLHGQSIPAPILFYREEVSPGVTVPTNTHLGFMKAHHFVVGYDRNLGPSWRWKSEVYYQRIADIPVEAASSSYSIINEGSDFIFDEKGSLVNDGSGYNYGIETTIEKFFSNNYYMLLTSSIFESQYKGSDGVRRSTSFNNNYVLNVLFGKEWKFGAGGRNAWTFDTRLTTSGGRPYTPIDLEATRANGGREVRMTEVAYSERYGTYFRWDVKFGVRLNSGKRNVSHQFFVDLQNVTDRKNEFIKRYNEATDEINQVDQIGFFPDMMYRIQF